MTVLEKIRTMLAEDMRGYEDFIRLAFKHEEQFIAEVLDYIIENRGKGIRPILSLLMANIHSSTGTLSRRAYLVAMLVEMIHTASLVHDDVIDHAEIRHGKSSVSKLWGNQSAVLVGDYILAKAFSSGMESGQYDVVNYITQAMKTLCEGELIQADLSSSLEMTRERYFDVIRRKTATLLGTACGAGAMAAGANRTAVAIARQIGDSMGMAFQIKDDILDYAPSTQTGKPTCADLREHKITLPLIILLEQATPEEELAIKEIIRGIGPDGKGSEKIVALIERADGIKIATEVMDHFLAEARSLIESYPDTEWRGALLELCDYIGQRNF